jgi:hypothetical protein
MNERADPGPWYRQPWPWIVMSGPALAVVGSLVSAYLAVRGADPIVDENYYEHGLQINSQLARLKQANRMGLRTDLQLAGVRRGDEVRVQVASSQPLRDTAIRVRLVDQRGEYTERSAVLGRVPGSDPVASFYGQWLQAPDDQLTVTGGSWRAVIEGAEWQIEGAGGASVHLVAGSCPADC